ncbi:MAG: hypothetical protein B6D37_10930 [Sphingobacteriales bacterium UTBCD1]|jgi:hypothetical protein|nr:MAG: hypothetical protein B6D37_10930 [Sphingobacteriales bacterium UTBCD1]
MKFHIILSVVFCSVLSLNSFSNNASSHIKIPEDSVIIRHILDGSVSEWPQNKFETDKETGISYAIDNDADDLFLAVTIPDFRTQMKMMRLGMNLYIDLKGKKKEHRGIEFPVKRDADGSATGNSEINSDEDNSSAGTDMEKHSASKQNMKTIRSEMALNLIYMRLFGFSDEEPVRQGLRKANSAQVAFTWDSSDVMHIEYLIPLKMLDDDLAALNQKKISVGWKINGMEMTPGAGSEFGNSSYGSSGGRRGGGGGFRREGGNGNISQGNRQKMSAPESFWTKYTFVISSN